MAELLHSWREAAQTQQVPAGTAGSIRQGELGLLALPDPLPHWHTQVHFSSFQQRPWGREEVLHPSSCSHKTVLLSAKLGGFPRRSFRAVPSLVPAVPIPQAGPQPFQRVT